jgi:hypothetical protein
MIIERCLVARFFDVVALHKPQFALSRDSIAVLYSTGLRAAAKYRLDRQRAELCLARGRGALQRMDCHDLAGSRRIAGAAKLKTAVVCRMARFGNLAIVLQLLMRAHQQEQTAARRQLGRHWVALCIMPDSSAARAFQRH